MSRLWEWRARLLGRDLHKRILLEWRWHGFYCKYMYVFTQQSAIAIRKGYCLKWLVAQSKEAQSTGPSFALSAANY